MRWLLRLTIGLVVVVAALPFIVLSAMGVMRPTEGFCVESVQDWAGRGWSDPPTAQEQAQSYFVSPELGDPTVRVPFIDRILGFADHEEGLNWRWPVCMKTRRAEHQLVAGRYELQLKKLGEPNLRRTVQTGAAYRVLTVPSFSRVPIAFRLEVPGPSGEGTLHSTWLEDDGTRPDETKTTPAGDQAWWDATLPKRSMERTLTVQQTRALQLQFSDLPPYQTFNLDGIGLVIEAVHEGRRDARAAFLFPPPDPTGRLFCAVAKQSGISERILADGHVNFCGHHPTEAKDR